MNSLTSVSPRWFVVDDEALILSMTEQVLRRFTVADVRGCMDPSEALDRMGAAPEHLELLVTDLNMPGMNGLELARRVRILAPRAKVVLITGSAMALPDARTLAAHGVDFLLPKPFGVKELMSALRGLCGAESFRAN